MTLVLLALVALGCFLLVRNERVYRERLRVLDIVSERSQEDIRSGRQWGWRYEGFRGIRYGDMLFSFRPVESFYANSPILK